MTSRNSDEPMTEKSAVKNRFISKI